MQQKTLLFILLALFGAIAVVHGLGVAYFWYWQYWWLDIVMHFAGGLAVGLAAAGVAYGVIEPIQKFGVLSVWKWLQKKKLLTIVFSVLFVGGVWEVFEYMLDVAMAENYFFDTMLDFLMDTLGAVVAAVIGLVTMRTSPQEAQQDELANI